MARRAASGAFALRLFSSSARMPRKCGASSFVAKPQRSAAITVPSRIFITRDRFSLFGGYGLGGEGFSVTSRSPTVLRYVLPRQLALDASVRLGSEAEAFRILRGSQCWPLSNVKESETHILARLGDDYRPVGSVLQAEPCEWALELGGGGFGGPAKLVLVDVGAGRRRLLLCRANARDHEVGECDALTLRQRGLSMALHLPEHLAEDERALTLAAVIAVDLDCLWPAARNAQLLEVGINLAFYALEHALRSRRHHASEAHWGSNVDDAAEGHHPSEGELSSRSKRAAVEKTSRWGGLKVEDELAGHLREVGREARESNARWGSRSTETHPERSWDGQSAAEMLSEHLREVARETAEENQRWARKGGGR